jgi:hypothetical protein
MSTHRTPDLPGLDPGVQLVTSDRRVGHPLRALALDHVLAADGPAYWVDGRGRGRAVAGALAELAPDPRAADRVRVVRGLAGRRRAGLVEALSETVDGKASLLVLPAVDAIYRGEGSPPERARERLLRALSRLARLARDRDLPVLLSRQRDDRLGGLVADLAHRTLRYRETPSGPRFSGPDFEAHVYPVGDGAVQPPFALWQQVLTHRAALHAASGSERERGVLAPRQRP